MKLRKEYSFVFALVLLLLAIGILHITTQSPGDGAEFRGKFEPWLWSKLEAENEPADRWVCLIIRSHSSAESVELAKTLRTDPDIKDIETFRSSPVMIAQVKASGVRALASNPLVESVGDGERKCVPFCDVATQVVSAKLAWEACGLNGSGITIAVLDSGIDTSHPDLNGSKVVVQVDCTVEGNQTGNPDDDMGHGTHCAGIAAGTGAAENGTYRGVAFDAKIANVKVLSLFGQASQEAANVIRGLNWVINNRDQYSIKVVSMSLGFYSLAPNECIGDCQICRRVDDAVDAGLVVVAAQGNHYKPNINGYQCDEVVWKGEYPTGAFANQSGLYCVRAAACPGAASKAIAVGGYDDKNTVNLTDDTMWTVSVEQYRSPPQTLSVLGSLTGPTNYTHSCRTKPDIVAPACDILSCCWATNRGTYGYYWSKSGTSMATPMVAGAAALVLQEHPSWNPFTVKEALKNTADLTGDLGTTYDSYYYVTTPNGSQSGGAVNVRGAGLVNATAAVLAHQLQVRTSVVGGSEVSGAGVLVNGSAYVSRAYTAVANGTYNVTVPVQFYSGGRYYNFTMWDDNTTSTSRMISIYNDTSITAYYQYILRRLVIQVPQAPSEGVSIWVDGQTYTANATHPVNITVQAGQHTLQAQYAFLKEEIEPGTYYLYTFDSWSDGYTDNPRNITMASDTTIQALYWRDDTGIERMEPG
jgi:subtilisin family serine protease